MPPLKIVSKLSVLGEDFVWRWLLTLLKSNISMKKRTALHLYVLKNLNFNVRQKVLNCALAVHKYRLEMSDKILLIDVLGDVNTNCIDLTKGGFIFIEEVFQLYHILSRNQYRRVNILGIDCKVVPSEVKYIHDVNSIYYRQLKVMNGLTRVTLRGVAESELLSVLGCCCPHLEYLDIANSFLVTDTSIAQFIFKEDTLNGAIKNKMSSLPTENSNLCCSTLTFLNVTGTDISQSGIILILLHLPNLASFGGYISYACLVKSLLAVKKLGVRSLSLTHLSISSMDEQKSATISDLCPNTEYIAIGFESLTSVAIFPNLSTLMVECDYKDCECEVNNCLSVCGSNLTSLTLIDASVAELDPIYISKLAPNLKSLSASFYLPEGKSYMDWSSLEEATIQVSNSTCLEMVLVGCKNLRNLQITFCAKPYEVDCSSVNDALIQRVLSNGGLRQIAQLTIMDCGLGIKGLDALLTACSKLKILGKLSYWRSLTDFDIRNTFKRIKMSNWDLHIVVVDMYIDTKY